MSGYVAISRDLFNDPDFDREPMSQREAWIWLIAEAAWKPCTVHRNGSTIELQRGQVAHSIRFMAEAWGWHRSRVDRFLKSLKSKGMVSGACETAVGTAVGTASETRRETGVTVISICNYNRYQSGGTAKRDSKRDASRDTNRDSSRDKLEPVTNKPTDTNVSVDIPDPIHQAFEIYNEVCGGAGLPRVQKRSQTRKASLRRRLDDCGGLEGWRAACQRVVSTPFMMGENDRGWKADFDFLITESKFTRLMEGGYDRSAGAKPNGNGSDRHQSNTDRRRNAWLDAVEEYERDGAGGNGGQPGGNPRVEVLSGPSGGRFDPG